MLPFALLLNSGALTNFQIVLEASTMLEGSSNIPSEEAREREPTNQIQPATDSCLCGLQLPTDYTSGNTIQLP